MNPHLIAHQRIPYGGGYRLTDPLTKVEVYGINMEMVMARVTAERKANGHGVGIGLWEEVEQWICQAYPQECEKSDKVRVRPLEAADILHGTRVLISHFLGGSKLVDQEEANRRAEICSRCPMNLAVPMPCGSGGICQDLLDFIKGTVGDRITPHNDALKHCNICGCSLQAAVWYPLETQCKGVTQDQKEQFATIKECWKKCP